MDAEDVVNFWRKRPRKSSSSWNPLEMTNASSAGVNVRKRCGVTVPLVGMVRCGPLSEGGRFVPQHLDHLTFLREGSG